MDLRDIASIIGTVGGLSGFTTLAYTIRKDRRASNAAAAAKVLVKADFMTKGLYAFEFSPDDRSQELYLELKPKKAGTLRFYVPSFGVSDFGEQTVGKLSTAMPEITANFNGGNRAHIFIERGAPTKHAPEVLIAVRIVGTKKVIARTSRHINS